MKIKIFGYSKIQKYAVIDDSRIKDIVVIAVHDITGDEIVHVVYDDGKYNLFDGGENRLNDYYEYSCYYVGKQIQQWLDKRKITEE